MLRLRPPAWAEGFSVSSKEKEENNKASISSSSSSAGSSSSVSPSVSSSTSPASSLISELVTSLTNRRLFREVKLALRSSLEDARADFSFLRLRGLKALLKFLASTSTSEALIYMFQDTQSDKNLQVVPVLFQHSLAPSTRNPPVFSGGSLSFEEPEQVVSPPTDYEVALALRVLQGCCLLDKGSRMIASQHMAIKEVIELLSAGGLLEQGACLDALPALMLDTPINQQEFLSHQGVQKVSELVKHGHVDESMRLKGAEFLLLLVSNVLRHDGEVHSSVDMAVAKLHEHLGDAFFSVLREAEQVGTPFSDAKRRENALYLQAKQLLELLDSG